MPKKPNFLGGMQNYNPNNGEYEPNLVGSNGKVVKDADGDGVSHESKKKELTFEKAVKGVDNDFLDSQFGKDTPERKLVGAIKEEVNQEDFEEISEGLADYQWMITDKTTVGQYAEEVGNKLGKSKEQVLSVIRNENADIKETDKMSVVAGLEEEQDFDDPSEAAHNKAEEKEFSVSKKQFDPKDLQMGKLTTEEMKEYVSNFGYKVKNIEEKDGKIHLTIDGDANYKNQVYKELFDEVGDERNIYNYKDTIAIDTENHSQMKQRLDSEKEDFVKKALESGKYKGSKEEIAEQIYQDGDMFSIHSRQQALDLVDKYYNESKQQKYPKGTSKEYTDEVNASYSKALPVLEKAGIKLEEFKGETNSRGGFDTNAKEITDKYVFNPFREKYPNGNNDAWDREYKELYDAIETVLDKQYNDWYIKNAPYGY